MADMEWQDEGWQDLVTELYAESVEVGMMAVKEVAMDLENAVKRKLTGQRSGIRYVRKVTDPVTGKSQRTEWTASRPGEPPAVLFGNLRQAVTHTEPELVGDTITSQVGVDLQVVPYARRLELGDAHIAPRPYLRTTFNEQRANMEAKLQRLVGGR